MALLSTALTLFLLETTMWVLDSAGLFGTFFKKLEMSVPGFDLETGAGLYYSHPYISYELRPGYESGGKAHINSLGFRGDFVAEKKPPGTLRIVAIGDSTTYGIHNHYDETYPYLLQRQLRERFYTDRVEVINAGLVSATSTENLIRFQLRILPLRPDVIVLYGSGDVFPRVFNDYKGDYSHFRRTPSAKETNLEKFYVAKLAKSVLWRAWPQGRLKNSNLLEYTWRSENLPPDEAHRIANFRKSDAEVFRRNLKYIIDLASANAVKPVLVTFAYNRHGGNWLPTIPAVVWEKGIEDNNRVLLALAEAYDLPLCDFHAYGLNDNAVFKDSIHLTEYGNSKLAECILHAIERIARPRLSDSHGGSD